MNERKTILYVGGFELPDKNAAAHRVIANSKIFYDLGYDVHLIGISKSLDRNIPLKETKKTFENFVYYNLPYPEGIQEWLIHLTKISYKSLIDQIKPSIIIAYNYPSFALNDLLKYCKNKGIKLIADSTEWYSPNGNILFKLFKGIDTWYRMRIIQRRLDGIIVISKFLFDFYTANRINVIYVPPLVDKAMDKWKAVDLNKFNFSSINLVFAGTIGRGEKDRLDKIIKGLILIKDGLPLPVKLIVIGVTEHQYIKIFKPKDDLMIKIKTFVSFRGKLAHNDAINVIKSSDFEIFLRDNTRVNTAGFPTKFVESLTCGTPVLANLSSNIGMYLQEEINGFILDMSTENSLVKSMKRALTTPKEEIIKMKKNCLMMDDFDYRKYINMVSVFLKKLV